MNDLKIITSLDLFYQTFKMKFPNLYAEIKDEMDVNYKYCKAIHRKEVVDAFEKRPISISHSKGAEYYDDVYGKD